MPRLASLLWQISCLTSLILAQNNDVESSTSEQIPHLRQAKLGWEKEQKDLLYVVPGRGHQIYDDSARVSSYILWKREELDFEKGELQQKYAELKELLKSRAKQNLLYYANSQTDNHLSLKARIVYNTLLEGKEVLETTVMAANKLFDYIPHLPSAAANHTCQLLVPILEPFEVCLLYTSPSPRDKRQSRMPSSA